LFTNIGREPQRARSLNDFSFERTIADEILPGSFRQELIYNGKAGDNLKFLYREIKDSFLRAPFTQEAIYDLKDGDIIGFKGARLHVVDATNTKIRDQVLKQFD
jgi:hypothetical protein